MERPHVPTLIHTGIAASLCALTFAVYAQVRHHAFVNIDDFIYIVNNPNLARGLSLDSVVRAFSQPYEANWIPLTWISLLIDHAWFGFEPAGYHLVNVGLHASSAVLLYFALGRLTAAWGPSAFAAAVFAVHPIHVESVAWASERKDTLSGVFFMLTLLAYSNYCRARTLPRYLLVAAALSLGLLAKPMLVSLPLLLLLLDYWPLRRLGPDRLPDPVLLGRAVVEKLPLVAICAAVAAVTMIAQEWGGALWPSEMMSFPLRVMNALNSYVAYLGDSFWPTSLGIFYPHLLAKSSMQVAAINTAVLVAISLVCASLARAHPAVVVGWLWYLIALLPVIGLIQVGIQGRADRFMYLPQLGLTIAVAWLAHERFGRGPVWRAGLAILGAASIGALAWIASHQVTHWRDTMALYARAVAVNADNATAQLGLADELRNAGRTDEAQSHYERTIALKPSWAFAHIGLAYTHSSQGRLQQAIDGYERALQFAPRNALAHASLGKALSEAGEHERAIHHSRRGVALYGRRPTPEALANLAFVLAESGELGEAEQHYQRAIEKRPGYASAHAHLGLLLLRDGRPIEACEHIETARELGEASPEFFAGLAHAAQTLGDLATATDHYRAALRARPGWVGIANNLAWLLATHPDASQRDGEEAVGILEGLTETGRRRPEVLDTLAAAHATAGRLGQARETAREGVRRARAQEASALASQIEERLALYRMDTRYVTVRRLVGQASCVSTTTTR